MDVIHGGIRLIKWLAGWTSTQRDEARMPAEEIMAKMQFQHLEIGGPLKCLVCGEEVIKEKVFLCTSCQAPFHEDCASYAGRCYRYGCKSKTLKPYSVDVIA